MPCPRTQRHLARPEMELATFRFPNRSATLRTNTLTHTHADTHGDTHTHADTQAGPSSQQDMLVEMQPGDQGVRLEAGDQGVRLEAGDQGVRL